MGSSAISLKPRLQSVVALSTTKAEYLAVAHARKEAVSLKICLGELKVKQDVMGMNCDNQSVIHLAKNTMFYSRMKHINIQYHFMRNVMDDGYISLLRDHIVVNLADILTKPMTREKFNWSMTSLGLGAT
uniref:Retrovirus-related Pol polyprotein from transposon TNT 1-94 n=1 Tax=Ananas comosus var. bracteatus TaxID=296719 RepID=A0A6V7P9T4_ANACO|nr:unnamed protein product [Ananas comosus var. bracteatus]